MAPEFATWIHDQIGLSDIVSAVGIAAALSFLEVDLNVIGTLLGIAIARRFSRVRSTDTMSIRRRSPGSVSGCSPSLLEGSNYGKAATGSAGRCSPSAAGSVSTACMRGGPTARAAPTRN